MSDFLVGRGSLASFSFGFHHSLSDREEWMFFLLSLLEELYLDLGVGMFVCGAPTLRRDSFVNPSS